MIELKLNLKHSEGLTYKKNVPYIFLHFFFQDLDGKSIEFEVKINIMVNEFIYKETQQFKKIEHIIRTHSNNIQKYYENTLKEIEYIIKETFRLILTANSDCWNKRTIHIENFIENNGSENGFDKD